MDELKYEPITHDHQVFLEEAMRRKGFRQAYGDLGEEYALIRELLAARTRAGLTQEAVARFMGTTKSAVSRLESAGRHSPSMATLRKYAEAVGCHLEIRLVPDARPSGLPADRAGERCAG
ncbi:helix-turn-helix domain-containing protein [Desulfonatronum thioautotrophicum]|uniref:helix-turn-helix domain-containing protein n=1 Tax=Desulfonatronum thioautotrophicum TaxID=617001 RepID=UPI0005EBA5CA|nr:helix-turn-helix transcriptional regulator [Desulfonatronum thioautotrophicum]